MFPRRLPAGLLLTVAVATSVLVGCSSDGSDGAAVTTTTVTSSSSSTTTTNGDSMTTITLPPQSSSTVPVPRPQPCTSGAPAVPAGAVTGPIIDVDGDGRSDQGFVDIADGGTVTVGIVTAAGGGATTTFDSASPVKRSMFVVDADEQGPVEVLLDDGRLVRLHAFVDCKIVPVTNPQGETYTFGLGFTDVGTGIGCVDTPDGRRLVGLDKPSEPTGDTVTWTSTQIDLDGTHATNGATKSGTYTSPADDAKIALLNQVTCGDRTESADAITATA